MVLEAVMFCIDNSEWMRNGDYSPSRLEAQNEAVNYVARAKTEGNQETSVALLSMAGSRVRVHSSLTRDLGRIMNSLAEDVVCGGKSNLVGALKTAQLALKNRLNKNQRQRIVVFVGSPVEAEAKELTRVAKQLKKNSVAVDIVNFGSENQENANGELLQAFVDAVNSNDNSHLVSIPPGPGMLSDRVVTSAVMGDAAVAPGGGGGGFGGGGGDFGGINPNDDPELAMALQMSMQEEQARQAAARGDEAGGDAAAPAAAAADNDVAMDDEEALLQQAIAMSMAMHEESSGAAAAAEADEPADAEMQDAAAAAAADDVEQALEDPSFIESLLDEVGVNKEDADIDDILKGLSDDKSQKKKDGDGAGSQ